MHYSKLLDLSMQAHLNVTKGMQARDKERKQPHQVNTYCLDLTQTTIWKNKYTNTLQDMTLTYVDHICHKCISVKEATTNVINFNWNFVARYYQETVKR